MQRFEWQLEENIFELHRELKSGKYKHGHYKPFYIQDPKQRLIHKATVKDRVVHHAIFSVLNPIFEPTFIANSFSCRVGKGTHKGVEKLAKILRRVSRNNTGICFALKCDIKKFFYSIDHEILLGILGKRIKDKNTIALLNEIIGSFSSVVLLREGGARHGMPIGNLTSQLFANIYLNELDQFIMHNLKVKNYVRYTDDFVVVNEDRKYLESLIEPISLFLEKILKLSLHPNKLTIRKYGQGIDFLGYVILPYYRVLRTKTKKRILRNLKKHLEEYKNGLISEDSLDQSIASYLGVLSHADTFEFKEYLLRLIEFGKKD